MPGPVQLGARHGADRPGADPRRRTVRDLQREFTFNNIRQMNRNGLLWDNSLNVDVKTGHTDAAG
ncbi:hypothetical protein M8494_37110 [Serratia ureilytica]